MLRRVRWHVIHVAGNEAPTAMVMVGVSVGRVCHTAHPSVTRGRRCDVRCSLTTVGSPWVPTATTGCPWGERQLRSMIRTQADFILLNIY